MFPVLGLICALWFSVNLAVTVQDEVPDIYDPMHLERDGRLLAAGIQGNHDALEQFYEATAGSDYPMLVHYATLPVRLIVGAEPRAGAVGVMLFTLLVIVSAFGLAHIMGGDRAGLYAAILTALTPGLYRFSRIEMTDAPLAAMITLAMLALYHSDGLRRRGWSVMVGLACGLGMLTKQSFPIYFTLPASFLVGFGFAQDKRSLWKSRAQNFLLAFVLASSITVAYYLPGIGEWVKSRATVRTFALAADQVDFLDYLWLLVREGLGPALTFLALIGLLVLPKRDRGYRALILWIFAPLVALPSVFGLLTTRYLLPLLPAATVLGALGLEQIMATVRKPVSRWLILILVFGSTGATVVYDHFKVDKQAFSFDDFENRLHIVGIPRPQQLSWSVEPIVSRVGDNLNGRRMVMLFDSPYSSAVQGAIWLRNPLADVTNLFENASLGRTPPELANSELVKAYLQEADYLLVKTGFDVDPSNYSQPLNVDPDFAKDVFAAFFKVKKRFELVDSFDYPEDEGPVLLYHRVAPLEPESEQTADSTPTPPAQ